MEARSLELSELLDRQRWLINLRWTAAAGVAIIVAALKWLVGIDLQVVPLFAIAAIIALYNLAFWLYARGQRLDSRLSTLDSGQVRRAVIAANLQISLDLIALTFLLHFVGGVENPFYLYYIFHVIIASILLSRLAAFLQTSLAVVLFSGLAVLEFYSILPHVSVTELGTGDHYNKSIYVIAVLSSFISTLYFAVYAATSIVQGLRAREVRIIELNEALERDEHQLHAAYGKLQEVERFKSQYMRKVSHELRAPLSSIQSLITVVLEGLTGPIPEKTREILGRASARTTELLNLVADILTLSRTREVKLEEERKEVSLADIAARILPLFQAQAVDKGIDLSVSIEPNLPPLWADPEGMEELLTNLISNAIKYTPSGGKIWLTIKAIDGNIVLSVSDTGIGIAPEEIPHIFEEFYRTKRARELVQEGTGLGLPIVKAIVDAHGGHISVHSKVGEGTTIVVTLPRVESFKEGRESRVEEGGNWTQEGGQKGEEGKRERGKEETEWPKAASTLLTLSPFAPFPLFAILDPNNTRGQDL